MIPIRRTNIRILADPRKVVPRFLDFGDPIRFKAVIDYVIGIKDEEAEEQLERIFYDFQSRHFDLDSIFMENYKKLAGFGSRDLSPVKKRLTGAFFTHEYSIEAAALFNPSIVPHPDQTGLGKGELRFVLSLRACGEGHISSVTFQTGVITSDGNIRLNARAEKLTCGERKKNLKLSKPFVLRRIESDGVIHNLVGKSLPDQFSEEEALAIINQLEQEFASGLSTDKKNICRVFDTNYDLVFQKDTPLSSQVIFPGSPSESNGMEDVRFVAFRDGKERKYLGTYTAYNGREIRPQLIETEDFRHFRIRPFYGKAAVNKGMALFPEKINGQYAMVGRQDGRNLSIMYSRDLYFWDNFKVIQQPERSWEMLQMGNCGSPVKTPHGWLLLTHAVGPMRKYVLSFTLLDLEEPEKVLASLDQPLLSPNEEEREGYVPNVLYTCGFIQHRDKLIIPYAMSDSAVSFATVDTEAVIKAL